MADRSVLLASTVIGRHPSRQSLLAMCAVSAEVARRKREGIVILDEASTHPIQTPRA